MPDTVASSLWLSLVDMLVVFAVLTLLMLVCYGLKFFSRESLSGGSADDEDSQGGATAGDESAAVDPGRRAINGPVGISLDGGGLTMATVRSRVFKISVNGKVFDVGVEQATGVQPVSQVATVPAPVAQQPAVVPLSPPAVSRPAPSAHTAGASNLMKSPLPGKILKLFAAPGKAFKRGDTLLTIEAMKMENEILAPRDCVVGEVYVGVNQSVKTGKPLLRLE